MKKNYHYSNVTIIQGSQIIKGVMLIIVLLLFIFSISGLLTTIKAEYRPSSESVNEAASVFTGRMLFSILAMENEYFAASIKEEEKLDSIPKQLLKLSANISLDDPRSLLGRELPGFSLFDSQILVAGEGTDYTNMPYESSPPNDEIPTGDTPLQNVDDLESNPDEVTPPINSETTGGRKVVFIYHTHNRESFLPYLKGVTDINAASHSEINITKVGERLQKSLEERGIGADVDTTDIMDRLVKKGLKYSKSYQESRAVIQEAMTDNKEMAYLIDIHRDSKRKKDTTVTIDGKEYAKLAFIVGGNNAEYQKNYALAEKIHKALVKQFPGISRGVFKQGGAKHNGKYNQDLSEKAMLLEVGGVDNTFEELYRSMDAFAEVFRTYYWEENEAQEVNAD
ncbi:MAG: stage II sporulation protein P [Bacillus sp. (in: firmicutes)]